jgi:hypothetical protein
MFLLSFIYAALSGSGISRFKSLCILGILVSSALSVSAMNSIFTTLFLAIAISTYSKPKLEVPTAFNGQKTPLQPQPLLAQNSNLKDMP